MEFLFHTAIDWDGELAFFTIFLLGPDRYFAQVHEPLKNGAADVGFWLDSEGKWQCDKEVSASHIQVFGEEIEQWRRTQS